MEKKEKEKTPKKNQKVVSFTEKAAEKIKNLMEKEGKSNKGLRLSVQIGGCSGFVYSMSFEGEPKKDDSVNEENGLKVFIDQKSRKLINGTTINYTESLQGAGFVFNNPNAKAVCGCGRSFG